jgi:hypothetical protein
LSVMVDMTRNFGSNEQRQMRTLPTVRHAGSLLIDKTSSYGT